MEENTLGNQFLTKNTETFPTYWWKQQHNYASEKEHFCVRTGRISNITFIRVVGERKSGVAEVAKVLRLMYPDIYVGVGFVRGKYWFQSKKILQSFPDSFDINKVLVVVVARNPYDWVDDFGRNPIFAQNHVTKPFDWYNFVTKKWTMKQNPSDTVISQTPGARCQAKFNAGEVVPCRHSSSDVSSMSLYEMNPKTNRAFRDIFELRKAKLEHYLSLSTWVPNIEYLTIERFADTSNLQSLVDKWNSKFNIQGCELNADIETKMGAFLQTYMQRKQLPENFERHVTCNTYWKVEEKFEYTKSRFSCAGRK